MRASWRVRRRCNRILVGAALGRSEEVRRRPSSQRRDHRSHETAGRRLSCNGTILSRWGRGPAQRRTGDPTQPGRRQGPAVLGHRGSSGVPPRAAAAPSRGPRRRCCRRHTQNAAPLHPPQDDGRPRRIRPIITVISL